MEPTELDPAILHFLPLFEYDHLPTHLRDVSAPFCDLAGKCAYELEGPVAVECLHKLLEARDCAVRAVVLATKATEAEARL